MYFFMKCNIYIKGVLDVQIYTKLLLLFYEKIFRNLLKNCIF